MEEKKNNKGLVWLIVILIIMILGLVGYIVYDKVLYKTKEPINNKSTTTINSSQVGNDNKELIYVCKKITDENNYQLDVPCIASDNENAKKINNEIYDKIYENRMFEKVDYEYFTNDNIISLVININGWMGDGPNNVYLVYNFNKDTYETISNEQILNYVNKVPTKFINDYNNIIKTSFEEEKKQYEENGFTGITIYYHEINNVEDFKLYLKDKILYAVASVSFGDTMGEVKVIEIR